MKKSLTFHQPPSSHKFWRVSVEGTIVTVVYGKVGTVGRSEEKKFDSAEEAKSETKKLVAEKLKKGYKEEKAKAFGEVEF